MTCLQDDRRFGFPRTETLGVRRRSGRGDGRIVQRRQGEAVGVMPRGRLGSADPVENSYGRRRLSVEKFFAVGFSVRLSIWEGPTFGIGQSHK